MTAPTLSRTGTRTGLASTCAPSSAASTKRCSARTTLTARTCSRWTRRSSRRWASTRSATACACSSASRSSGPRPTPTKRSGIGYEPFGPYPSIDAALTRHTGFLWRSRHSVHAILGLPPAVGLRRPGHAHASRKQALFQATGPVEHVGRRKAQLSAQLAHVERRHPRSSDALRPEPRLRLRRRSQLGAATRLPAVRPSGNDPYQE